MKKHRLWTVLAALVSLSLVLAACAPAEPEVIEVTRVVTEKEEVEVTREVEVPVGGQLIHIVARCKASPPHEEGRCNNLVSAVGATNAALAEAGDERRIELEIIQDNADWGDYKTEFELASDAGAAPDIVCSGHEHIGDWGPAGYLTDITGMLGDYPEFDDVIDALWASTEWNGSRWGVPQDAEARPMFYNKTLLAELGWSDADIESLPDRIMSGEFTWEDMFDTAEEAVTAGVGELVGDGDALIFDQEAALKVYEKLYAAVDRGILSDTRLDGDWTGWHTGITNGDVLFMFGGSWNWAEWFSNYVVDRGGEDYLWEHFGFAAIPGMANGTGNPTTLTHPLIYMISSASEHPDLALLLISKASVKELNTDYAIASGHLGILKSQAEYGPYTSAKFLTQVLPLLDVTTFLPNSPYWSAWSNGYYEGILAAESGFSAEDALEVAVDYLQNELGDNVIIR
jgi:inositol-phosphate transport system substrate-binding protein